MQTHQLIGQPQLDRAASPVFFTGCSNDAVIKKNDKHDPSEIIASIDFDQLKHSLNFVLSKTVSPVPASDHSAHQHGVQKGKSVQNQRLFPQPDSSCSTIQQSESFSFSHYHQHHEQQSSSYVSDGLEKGNQHFTHLPLPPSQNHISVGARLPQYTNSNVPGQSDDVNHNYERVLPYHSNPHLKKQPTKRPLLPTPDCISNNVVENTQQGLIPYPDEHPDDHLMPKKRRSLLHSPVQSHTDHLAPPLLEVAPIISSAAFEGDFESNHYKGEPPVPEYEAPISDTPRRADDYNRQTHRKRPIDLPYPEICNKRRKTVPRQPPKPRNHYSVWEQLTTDIWKLYMENKQSQAVYDSKMDLRNQLHSILLKTFPHCGLYVVGSSMTELGGNSSDMDMCLMLSHNEINQDDEATEILGRVYEIFRQYKFLQNLELIPAKVPILRFRDSVRKVDVDLNVNNAVGIRNTQLLRSYARMDERVSPLVLLIKMWAKCHGINDAKNHTLSSYSLVLMVIHFLQYGCSPPVLPCLQILMPDKFLPHSDVRTLKLLEDLPPFTSENAQPLSELFLGFLNYYANEFDYSSSVISVRTGSILPKIEAMNNASPKNKRGHWKHICIEEPFDMTNTACSVFKDSAFYYVRDVFLRSWNILRGSGNLQSILDLRRLSQKSP